MDKQEYIHSKGFNIVDPREQYRTVDGTTEYGKIKISTKTLDDAVLDLGTLKEINYRFSNKAFILKAIASRDYEMMRQISDYFYNTNGIYSRVCDYYAGLFRYDWYIVPEIEDEVNETSSKKILKDFDKILSYLDDSYIKKNCGDIALKVIKNGAYYGYITDTSNRLVLQDLPVDYCRSRFSCAGVPVVEFNMRFFDEKFKDVNYRLKVLQMFPKEFQKGYILYKQGKLTPSVSGDDTTREHNRERTYNGGYKCGWYPLEPGSTVKFSLSHGDQPLFINAIPALIDLDSAQDLDRRKQMQQLQKIIVQKLPLDKNGDLIFDVEEARDIHNNAIDMLSHSIGTDVLTTFADISVEDIADTSASSSSSDVLERMERAAYNAFGTSRNLFNTDGNLSLEKSIQDDESIMRQLVFEFVMFFDRIVKKLSSSKKKYCFRFYMLETTTNNYKDLSKLYKEQVQLGYSKMLPQIALGHSQSSIIHTAYFENEVQMLDEIMIPPLMSSTMNAESLQQIKAGKSGSSSTSSSSSSSTNPLGLEDKQVGRPEKSESEKSDKTLQNEESKS